MSRRGFQSALSAMILRPVLAREVRMGAEERLGQFDLTEGERRQLVAVAGQPGIAFYASLSRANRLEAIAEVFPQTLVTMKADLREFLNDFWPSSAPNHRLDREAELFAEALDAAIRNGRVTEQTVILTFQRECAAWQMALTRLWTGPS